MLLVTLGASLLNASIEFNSCLNIKNCYDILERAIILCTLNIQCLFWNYAKLIVAKGENCIELNICLKC